MSRIPTPATIDSSAALSHYLLTAVKQQLGSVPNLFRLTYLAKRVAHLEIVGHVALNTLTNYSNEVFEADIDFPAVRTKAAALIGTNATSAGPCRRSSSGDAHDTPANAL
jgi:hypothetical protein